jgi:peptide/nickel transport system substrate-binding protein
MDGGNKGVLMSRTSRETAARGLAESFIAGRLTRRQLIERAGLLGVGVSALGGLLSTAAFNPVGALAQNASELKVAISSDIDALDPHVSQALIFNDVIRSTVFNSLVNYDEKLNYVSGLAEKWENPDDKTYVFTLRDGVKFHNGQTLEASHVEFSFKRIAEKKTVFSGRVENVDTYTVVDAKTIKIALKAVQADFIDGLVLLSIMTPEIAADIDNTPVGTGPFKFVEWNTNANVSLERNPDYFVTGTPGVDKLTFQVITEPQVEISNVKSGTVNAALNIPVAQATPLKSDSSLTTLITATSSIPMFELMGKQSDPVRQSSAVRQALAYALDKDAVQKTVYSGAGVPKWSWIPTSSWAYKEEAGYPYDPDKAKTLLSNASVSGLELTCIIPGGFPEGEQTATIWQAGLEKAGVKLKLEVQELSVWLNNYINHTYDVTWNVFPGFADPNYFVQLGLKPHLADQWKNPEAAAIADAANQTIDQAQRKTMYDRFQDVFVQDLPIIVIQEVPVASLTAKNVTGLVTNPVGFSYFDGVKIS